MAIRGGGPSSDLAELGLVMALYDGEDWIESNCWYAEQPLESGPPPGPCAGAKWKRALCFRGNSPPRALVPGCLSYSEIRDSNGQSLAGGLSKIV